MALGSSCIASQQCFADLNADRSVREFRNKVVCVVLVIRVELCWNTSGMITSKTLFSSLGAHACQSEYYGISSQKMERCNVCKRQNIMHCAK